jgi:phage terminase large subunit-like protein
VNVFGFLYDIGIVVAGKGVDGRGYVLADRSCKLSPAGWGRRAVDAYHEFDADRIIADRIIAERNFGGAMVEHVIRTIDSKAAYAEVVASRGKVLRAEPIAALYEQGRITHVGSMPQLEDQMCSLSNEGYLGDGSPDRLDALVWAVTDLMLGGYQQITSFHIPVIASRPRANFDVPFSSMADAGLPVSFVDGVGTDKPGGF